MKMKGFDIREGQNGTGKIIGTVQANTPAGAKQRWRTVVRDRDNDTLAGSYWHMHCVRETEGGAA
jgi:hypothetical protein